MDEDKVIIYSFLQTNEMGAVNLSDPAYEKWICNVKILLSENDMKVKCYKKGRKHYVYIVDKIRPTSNINQVKYVHWTPYRSFKAAERDIEQIKLTYLARLI